MTNEQLNMVLPDEHILHAFSNVSERIREDTPTPRLYSHDYFEIALVDEGSGVLCIEDKMIPCRASDICLITPNTPHRFFLTEQSDALTVRRIVLSLKDWLRGDAAVAGSKRYCYGALSDGSTVAYTVLNAGLRQRIDVLFDAIEVELTERETEWTSVVCAHLVHLFTFVGRHVNSSIKDKNVPEKIRHGDTVCAAIKVVEAEFSDPDLSLEVIAKRLYTSPPQLSRRFKDYTGQLFSDYLRETRLRRAALLLEEERDMPVEQIVTRCGLRNVSSFYRNFKELFEMTPQAYRQKIPADGVNESINNNESEKKKMEILNEISLNLQAGKAKIVKELVQKALDEGVKPIDILEQGLLRGMSIIGEKFKSNEVYVPEVLVAARAMNMGSQVLKPHLAAEGVQATGKVCLGTVQGDLHDIGKNLVKMMMEGQGLEVVDLGTDVAPETFVQTAIEQNCQVIALSALLTTTMPVMEDVVKAAVAAGIRDKVKIMIGGAPVNDEFARKIGADAYTVDAATASEVAASYCKA